MNTEIDEMIRKLELAIHLDTYLTFDEMVDMNNFLHKLKENSARPAIFSEQYDLFTK